MSLAKQIVDLLETTREYSVAAPQMPSHLGLSKKDIARFDVMKLLRAMVLTGHSWEKEAAFELECSTTLARKFDRDSYSSAFVPAEILTRAMSTSSGSKGGYLVSTEPTTFIDALRARSVAYSMGATPLSGLQGNVPVPRQTGKASVSWQGGDGTSINAGDQALGELSVTPKTVIALTDVSEQLLRQTGGTAEAFVMNDLAKALAIDGVDNAVINGAGGAQPLGIKNTTGITSGQDAATATLAKLLAFVSTVGAANALGSAPGWVGNTAAATLLAGRQRFTGSDSPLWLGSPSNGTLTGYPAMSSEQIAAGNLIFGSWDSVVIADWGTLELSTSRGGTRFNTLQVGIRAMWMVDVLVRYPQSFVVSTNLS